MKFVRLVFDTAEPEAVTFAVGPLGKPAGTLAFRQRYNAYGAAVATYTIDQGGSLDYDQLAFDRMTAMQARAGINHLVEDQAELFTPGERDKLNDAKVVLREFVDRTARHVD